MVRLYCLVALLFLTANSSSPAAQQPPSAARSPLSSAAAQTPVFDGAVRSAVIDSLSARLVRSYISEDTARLIAAVLQRELRAGAYDTLRTAARFAEVVSRHLRTINDDRHLSLSYNPAPPRPPQSAPAGAAPPSSAARRQNYGLTKLEILPGNIGYLEISGFM